MRAILDIVFLILDLYLYAIIATAIMSWLIAFNVVNVRNDVVRSVWNALTAITEPFLAPIRRYLPNAGGLDLSPIVLYFAVVLIQRVLIYYVYPNVF